MFLLIKKTAIIALCVACECDSEGSTATTCSDSGQCDCRDNVEGITCDHCMDNTFGFPDCQPCDCNADGSDGLDCNFHGICTCKPHATGDKCDQCKTGYTNFPACDQCDAGHFGYPDCKPCTCDERGSKNMICNPVTGDCECLNENVSGSHCVDCKAGSYGFPTCSGTFTDLPFNLIYRSNRIRKLSMLSMQKHAIVILMGQQVAMMLANAFARITLKELVAITARTTFIVSQSVTVKITNYSSN